MKENGSKLERQIREALDQLDIIDCHSHIDPQHLSARGLHDILLYHMVISDLYSAGCPQGARLSENPDESEITERIELALPYVSKIQNTSCCWGLRTILSDLYDWHEPITNDNWRQLHQHIQERSSDPTWPREILNRCGVIRSSTEWALRPEDRADDILDYSLEWAFFARKQWGQNDAPLYELETTWNQDQPSPPLPVNLKNRPPLKRTIKTVDDVHLAMAHYGDLIPYDRVLSTAQHISTDINYSNVSRGKMAAALENRGKAANADCDLYASYLLDAFLTELEKHGHQIVFQFSLGAEPLPYETASRLSQNTISQLGDIIARHCGLHFQCFLASRHANQSLCTLARELPNLSLAGYWWHSFFPEAIKQVCAERLDMLPLNKQIGFFSDAYCMDWLYAKTHIVKSILAEVLARKIERGQYTFDQALHCAGYILKDSAQELLGMNNTLSKQNRSDNQFMESLK